MQPPVPDQSTLLATGRFDSLPKEGQAETAEATAIRRTRLRVVFEMFSNEAGQMDDACFERLIRALLACRDTRAPSHSSVRTAMAAVRAACAELLGRDPIPLEVADFVTIVEARALRAAPGELRLGLLGLPGRVRRTAAWTTMVGTGVPGFMARRALAVTGGGQRAALEYIRDVCMHACIFACVPFFLHVHACMCMHACAGACVRARACTHGCMHACALHVYSCVSEHRSAGRVLAVRQ